ncbi:glucosephosphate-mutase GPM2 [Cardiosporidium cionae]|uniref:Glucosephosphate-mutase GPM2 n=1 Tax=Cardiosporidium cionae TaxID=476202 RepID=A0ABQ7J8I4_9APIC|nr:glucosephosphate-mutase GPM2 [Cardiosporidium cionae]|eukprot:KAF8820287.1 glucosephosphate-mutase GPM2 [Cardiosporidium cionae]
MERLEDIEQILSAHAACRKWMKWQPKAGLYDETVELFENVVKGDVTGKQLRNLFEKRLVFGTGLCAYLLKTYGNEGCEAGVIIGFDGRRNSRNFAHCAAAVFLSKGFKVYLFDDVVPTPFIPFGVCEKGCFAGIMITASHNPKDDNGYKVYAKNGAQILSPMDSDVMTLINENSDPWESTWQYLRDDGSCLLAASADYHNPYDELFHLFVTKLTQELSVNKSIVEKYNLPIVYTSLHGVGYLPLKAVFASFGCHSGFHPVPSQKHPDADFPTIPFPNPEEKHALDASIQHADNIGAKLIIANDPDADRLSCAEKTSIGWKQFSGDQIGILLAEYRMTLLKQMGIAPSNMLFVATLVSSRLLERMAKKESAVYFDTLTGFKWIINKALDALALQPELVPVLLYEEALGFCVTKHIRDKDGISAAAVWLEMVSTLYSRSITVAEHLTSIYETYGYFQTRNSYFFCYDPDEIVKVFDTYRNKGAYKWKIGGFEVASIRDVTTGFDSNRVDKILEFPPTPETQMICLRFTNGGAATLRSSGTEPKIKYYCELSSDRKEEESSEAVIMRIQEDLTSLVEGLSNLFFQPHVFAVHPPK